MEENAVAAQGSESPPAHDGVLDVYTGALTPAKSESSRLLSSVEAAVPDAEATMSAGEDTDESASVDGVKEAVFLMAKSLSRGPGNRRNPWRALAALNLAALMDGCDDQLLPSSFRALERDLHFHPALLGRITLAQSLATSVSCPFWGFLADRYARKHIMTTGLLCWGLTTICLAFVEDYIQIMFLRALNGAFLGSIGPISQSILADITHDSKRGLQFGFLQMCTNGGRVLGGVVTTSVAMMPLWGFRGWRWTFLAVGFISVCLGLLVMVTVPEFRRSSYRRLNSQIVSRVLAPPEATKGEAQHAKDADSSDGVSRRESVEAVAEEENGLTQSASSFMSDVFSQSFGCASVLLVLAEGIVGTIPWSALSFYTLYWQYREFSDIRAGCVASAILGGAMIAGPLGGYAGDIVQAKYPAHGRIFLGQLSMICRIPLLLICLRYRLSFWPAFFFSFGVGLFSFAGVVVNRPLLTDLVKPAHRATVFAIVVAIEGACGSFLGAPMVGFIADRTYRRTHKDIFEIPLHHRSQNADALGIGMVLLTVGPWMLSILCYSAIHFTYARDKRRVMREIEQTEQEDESAYGSARSLVAPAIGYH